MKKQLSKKLTPFVIALIIFIPRASTTNAQTIKGNTNLGGGSFCYCLNVTLSCRGDVGCLKRCTAACKSKKTNISISYVSLSLTKSIIVFETSNQKMIREMEWQTNQISENS